MSKARVKKVSRVNPTWECIISDEQWKIYLTAINVAHETSSRFLLGGAFGLAAYTGRCRNTKDIDFFVLPSDKDRMIDALTKAGFEDFHPIQPYDRGWIYRATRNEVIVDVIWQTPNRRSEVDELWFARAGRIVLRGEELEVLPAEELLAIKLYVLQRDRCDWPDLINLLYTTCSELDWEHVLNRMNGEAPLIGGLLQVFNWVAPAQAQCLPKWVRQRFCLPEPTSEDLSMDPHFRVNLVDTRPWFAAFQPADKPMQV